MSVRSARRRLSMLLVIGGWIAASGVSGLLLPSGAAGVDEAADEAGPAIESSAVELAADSPEPESEPTPGQILAAEGLAADLKVQRLIGEVQAHLFERTKVAGEDQLVIDRQIANSQLEILETVGELIQIFHQQERADIDAGALRRQIEGYLETIGPGLFKHIDISEKQTAALRLQREAAEIDRRVEMEQKIAREIEWGNTLYGECLNQVERLESMGLSDVEFLKELKKRLEQRAMAEAGRLRIVNEELQGLRARAGDSPSDPNDQAELIALQTSKETTTASITRMLRYMEKLDLETAEYHKLVIMSTGAVTSDIFNPQVAVGLLEQGFDTLHSWLRENALTLFFRGILFLLIVAAFRLLSLVVRRVLVRALDVSKIQASQLLRSMLITIVTNSITLLGVLIALSQMGIEMGPLLAGLGIAGFIVGFALQDSLANFAAGMMILGYRPYDVGDLIEAAGVFGSVSHMSLVSTTILTIDNQTLIIPNGKIWGDVIKNVTNQKQRRVDMKFRVTYEDDVVRAEEIFRSILSNNDQVLSDPEPMIKVHKLEESAMIFVVRPWVETADYWDVYWDVTREVALRFGRDGLQIPYPRQRVQLDGASKSNPGPEADV